MLLTYQKILPLSLIAMLLLFPYHRIGSHGFIDSSIHDKPDLRSQNVYTFKDTVKIGNYFKVMDSIVSLYDSLLSYPISEHLIIRNNPWVIDSLAATDYYDLKERGITSLDPKEIPIFKPGDTLVIPDSTEVDSLNHLFEETYLDINIPEFKIRIWQKDSVIYKFPVRVGRNERKYLAMAGRTVDLRTHTGEGSIVQYSKNPVFINPADNHIYHLTHRDDGVLTGLPNIPWLVAEINRNRYGQLIHPTTNLETLGKAYSNGCIGTSEAAAWYIYYHAPLGTRIVIRYDLEVVDENGNTVWLQDVYDLYNQSL